MTGIKLCIGSRVRADGWKTFDISPGPEVDFVGDCCELTQFGDRSIDTIYASHVVEHLPYLDDLPAALAEWFRVLQPGGTVMISVPDFELLCRYFLKPELDREQRFHLMRIVFGGQMDPYDFHSVGLTHEFLGAYLHAAGFREIERVEDLGVFDDTSRLKIGGVAISLNMVARKPHD